MMIHIIFIFKKKITFLACGAAINLALYKEHAVECKVKLAKVLL
jgi:hypothetical protein